MKAAIYVRVSTEGQVIHGHGLDVQLTRCRAQAVVKGWEVTAVYKDEGISGTAVEGNRPGLSSAIDDACSGKVNAIIISSLDRLGRNTRLVLRLVDRFTQCGVSLVSCQETLDTSTPAGKFVLTMFAALAQLERDNIVERTTAGRNARGAIDGEKGGRVPYGYDRTAVGIAINHDHANVVRLMFDMRKRGHSLRAIAKELNENGHLSSRGREWTGSSVRWVLANEDKYKGGQRNESDCTWPVIIT